MRSILARRLSIKAKHGPIEQRTTALHRIGQLGGAIARDVLLEALRDPDPGIRGMAVLALRDYPGSGEALERSLGDESRHVRLAALYSLGKIGYAHAAPRVAALLGKDDDETSMALMILGELGDSQTLEYARPYLTSPRWEIRWDAAMALARLGDTSAIAKLHELKEHLDAPSDVHVADEVTIRKLARRTRVDGDTRRRRKRAETL